VPLNRRGTFNMEVQAGQSAWSATFDTTAGEARLPSITSLAVVDAFGSHAATLPRNGNGALFFSSTGNAAAVFFRRRGLQTWVQATAVETAQDETYGRIYRVNLADALRLDAGEIEIAIEIRNEQGNTARWQLTPAFAITANQTDGKRRSVRK
jgi:myo-inositol-hexaphosphate 3-phosphohydrolase